jgi:molybdopterin-guanine dinucleotide biosynthesis protein A
MSMPKDLLGIVLCGGESKRMGRDKGLLSLTAGGGSDGPGTWAGRAAGLLERLGIPYVFSVNIRQQEAYGTLFGPEKLVIDHLDIPGPLGGLLGIHQRYPEKDLLPLACDMIRMDRRTLEALMNVYREERPSGFYVYRLTGNDFAEPFPGIYCSPGLRQVYQDYMSGAMKTRSLQRVLEASGMTRYIPTADGTVFTNVNAL